MARTQIQGIIWSAVERFSAQGVQFILSIIIAKISFTLRLWTNSNAYNFLIYCPKFSRLRLFKCLNSKIDRTETDFLLFLF